MGKIDWTIRQGYLKHVMPGHAVSLPASMRRHTIFVDANHSSVDLQAGKPRYVIAIVCSPARALHVTACGSYVPF
jgi:hypothetical protein